MSQYISMDHIIYTDYNVPDLCRLLQAYGKYSGKNVLKCI